jgi:hypothetical protein
MGDPIAVDAAGAGELLGVSERTVRDWTFEGLLPTIDLSGGTLPDGTVARHRNRLYSVEALRRWALERSGYTRGEEVQDDVEEPGGPAQAVQAQRRAVAGRRPSRPRKPRSSSAPLPLRVHGG